MLPHILKRNRIFYELPKTFPRKYIILKILIFLARTFTKLLCTLYILKKTYVYAYLNIFISGLTVNHYKETELYHFLLYFILKINKEERRFENPICSS